MKATKITITPIIIFFTGCDDPTSNTERDINTEFVIFQNSERGTTESQINNLVEANVLQESQIKFSYENKITGFSATLSQSQIDILNSSEYADTGIIPGEFIIVFIDPFDSEKYGTEEGNQWSMKTIKKLQFKYGISDEQVLSRYGYAIFGFAAELSDEQLYELEQEILVDHIEPNAIFSLY